MSNAAEKYKELTSTEAVPYHFVGSGLPNVYLVGVHYLATKDGEQSAEIPCLLDLMSAIAEVLVKKASPLTADEIRFLRKRLRIASKDFARYVGLSVEQYSRVENGANVTPTVERLVRLLYGALAKLPVEEQEDVAKTTWSASLSAEERIIACQDKDHRWVVLIPAA